MTRFWTVNRHFLVFITVFAMLAATILVSASPTRAAIGDNCTGEADIIDAGTYYIVSGTWAGDWINCSASDKSVEIRGSFGDDYLVGSDFADTLKGGFGDDDLYGLDGNDWLFGGQDDDYMNGGDDTDTCLGGRGFDSFGGGGCETADFGLEP